MKVLPLRALEEIVRLSSASGPITGITAAAAPPMFAHTSLVKQGAGKHVLAVTLHASSSQHNIITAMDSFPRAPPANRRPRGLQLADLTHPLHQCLRLMMCSNEDWAAMNDSLNERNYEYLTLGTVMSTIEASPDLPACIQPAGLHDIQLHEYQKCVPICRV